MDINTTTQIGRLTRDPELKTTQTGKSLGIFSIAVNGYKEGEVNFFDVVVFGKQAENCAKYLKKGSQAAINGHLHQVRFERKDGTIGTKVEIVASSVQFLTSSKGGAAQSNEPREMSFDDIEAEMGKDEPFQDEPTIPF